MITTLPKYNTKDNSFNKLRPFSKKFRIQLEPSSFTSVHRRLKRKFSFFTSRRGWSNFYYKYRKNYKTLVKSFFSKPYRYLLERSASRRDYIYYKTRMLKMTKIFLKFFRFSLTKMSPSISNFYYLNYKNIKLNILSVSNKLKHNKKVVLSIQKRIVFRLMRRRRRYRLNKIKMILPPRIKKLKINKISTNTKKSIRVSIRNFWLRGYYHRFCLQFMQYNKKFNLYKKKNNYIKILKKNLKFFQIFYYYQLYLLRIFKKSKLKKFNSSLFFGTSLNKKTIVCLSSVDLFRYNSICENFLFFFMKNKFRLNRIDKQNFLSKNFLSKKSLSKKSLSKKSLSKKSLSRIDLLKKILVRKKLPKKKLPKKKLSKKNIIEIKVHSQDNSKLKRLAIEFINLQKDKRIKNLKNLNIKDIKNEFKLLDNLEKGFSKKYCYVNLFNSPNKLKVFFKKRLFLKKTFNSIFVKIYILLVILFIKLKKIVKEYHFLRNSEGYYKLGKLFEIMKTKMVIKGSFLEARYNERVGIYHLMKVLKRIKEPYSTKILNLRKVLRKIELKGNLGKLEKGVIKKTFFYNVMTRYLKIKGEKESLKEANSKLNFKFLIKYIELQAQRRIDISNFRIRFYKANEKHLRDLGIFLDDIRKRESLAKRKSEYLAEKKLLKRKKKLLKRKRKFLKTNILLKVKKKKKNFLLF